MAISIIIWDVLGTSPFFLFAYGLNKSWNFNNELQSSNKYRGMIFFYDDTGMIGKADFTDHKWLTNEGRSPL